ncbi:tetratricopeptide repeat protein [Novosphingobium flavum]|uniref:Tetratricopeptide repeat protein n=1 Tax=Novosphingobium aerophilum TaxID=2839843 RepID=A0A7X1KBQ9_9SPHN|nr:tetratricopeptide repeat protein [Novosphingobium aerophilum]MBC2651425.1 tetratricopeptide repeat protein [Novosphingobium aerophilum]MBC2663310.1 tetratricopeptide repeat protein [Novosphingobium aerophilum]
MVLRPHSNRSRPPVPAGAAPGAGGAGQQGEGFLREVDEALREQELLNAIKRHGRNVAIVIVVFLVGLAGYLWWENSQKATAGARGEELTLALDQIEAGRLDAGQTRLKDLTGAGDGIGAAARLMEAGVLIEQGKLADARTRFAAVAADPKAPQAYRDLATLRDVALGFDTIPVDQVVSRLKPLAVPGGAWFGSAGEMLGAAYLKQNRPDLAGPLFAAVARDKAVPSTLRDRARQMAGQLGVDAIDDVNEAANGGAGADNGRP